jgi:hypothetical protein
MGKAIDGLTNKSDTIQNLLGQLSSLLPKQEKVQ